MYQFKHADLLDLSRILVYNSRVYPERGKQIQSVIDFWMKRDEKAYHDIILVEHENHIYGQEFFSQMAFYYHGQLTNSHWCFDLIVDEQLRKEMIGLDFMQYTLNEYPDYYCTGSGPDAVKIHLALGKQMLGDIRKYVKIVNPLWIATALGRGKIASKKFPATIRTGWHKVCKLEEFPQLDTAFNEDLFEPVRDQKFIQWRFFNGFHPYVIYKNDESNDYFVLTTTVQKHITGLVLVDFRCSLANSEPFSKIMHAIHNVANRIHVPVVICGSSHVCVDNILEKLNYKSIGRPRPIMGTKNYKKEKSIIKERKFAFVTLADSDGEVLW